MLKVIQELLDEIKENLRTASRTARLWLQHENDEVINSGDEVSSIHILNQLQIPRQRDAFGRAFGHLNPSLVDTMVVPQLIYTLRHLRSLE